METVVVNLSGKARKETRNGREYLVASISLIVPGVLRGSQGPLYYPPDEVAKDPSIWNGVPIVVYHPVENGEYISARDPDTSSKYEVGRVYRSRISPRGNLVAEGWFDIEATRRINSGVLTALENGTQVEVSTGLTASYEKAAPGSRDTTGRPYELIARNYRPDHLAILPDRRGACSLKDGCGLNVLNTLEHLGNQDSSDRTLIANPMGKWQPPESGDAPKAVKAILRKVYSAYRDQHPAENAATKARGAKIAWGAVRKAGWVKVNGKWKKRKKVANEEDEMSAELESLLANEASFDNIRNQLYTKLKERFPPEMEMIDGREYEVSPPCYIVDVFNDSFVYVKEGDFWKLGYSVENDQVSLSSEIPTQVNQVTEYKTVGNECPPPPDGQGIPITNPSEESAMPKYTPEEKKQVVANLLANCNCPHDAPWKGKDEGALNALSDDTLALMDKCRQLMASNNQVPPVPTTPPPQVVWNPQTLQWQMVANNATLPVQAPVAQPAPMPVPNAPAAVPVTNHAPVQAPPGVPRTFAEMLNLASPEERAIWDSAMEIHNKNMSDMIDMIVTNTSSPEFVDQVRKIYAALAPDQLRVLVSAMPPKREEQATRPGFQWAGAAGPPPAHLAANEEPLMSPVYNFGTRTSGKVN